MARIDQIFFQSGPRVPSCPPLMWKYVASNFWKNELLKNFSSPRWSTAIAPLRSRRTTRQGRSSTSWAWRRSRRWTGLSISFVCSSQKLDRFTFRNYCSLSVKTVLIFGLTKQTYVMIYWPQVELQNCRTQNFHFKGCFKVRNVSFFEILILFQTNSPPPSPSPLTPRKWWLGRNLINGMRMSLAKSKLFSDIF